MFESILCQVTEYNPEVLESLIGLAVDIAREGREGRSVGTLFTFGDENAVLARSRPLILDPLSGHPESSLHVTNLNLRGTIKELAQLDGGFVVSGEGIFLSVCRYLDAVAAHRALDLDLAGAHGGRVAVGGLRPLHQRELRRREADADAQPGAAQEGAAVHRRDRSRHAAREARHQARRSDSAWTCLASEQHGDPFRPWWSGSTASRAR